MGFFKQKIFIVLGLLILSSCSMGYMKDPNVGLEVNYNGFYMDDVIMKIDEQQINTNRIPFGRRVFITFQKLGGYKVTNDLSSIGCEITVTDMQGDTLMYNADVFEFTDGGYDAKLMREISISLPALKPLKIGEKYHWVGRFWDKNSDAKMTSEVDVEIVDSIDLLQTENLAVSSQGVDYYAAFVEANYILLKENKVNPDKKLTLNVLNVSGFKKRDSLFTIKYYNSFKNTLSGENFEYFDTLYIEELRYLYSNYTMGTAVKNGETYLWTSKFEDLNSEAFLQAEIPLEIIEK